MNVMKLAVVLAIVAASPAMTGAQQPTDAQKAPAQERMQKMKDRLQLTPEQVEQVRPILTEEMEQLRALRDKHRGEQSRRARLRAARELKDIQENTDKKLKKVLTKKQMDELKKIREENREQLRDRAGR